MAGTHEKRKIVETTDQSELISQLMQRIADMQEQLQQTKDLTELAIVSNAPPLDIRRPPSPFPQLSCPLPDYFPTHTTGPVTSTLNHSVVDLTISNAPYASTSYQTQSPWLNQNQIHNTSHSQNLVPTHQITPSVLPKQPEHPFITFQAPQAYTFPNPCHSALVQPELDHCEEMEKEWRMKEEKREWEINAMKEAISQTVKSVQSSKKVIGLEYEDLCMHPDLEIPEGYKIPKFDTFNGVGNPKAHLRAYCNKLVGVGKDNALIMRLFSRSLSGEALEWFTSQELGRWSTWRALAQDFLERFQFNVEVVPDRYYLEKIKQKSTENYRDYALRWRKEVARVQPVMSDREITEMFIRIQEPKYYERMLCMMGQKFMEVIKVGEALEEGFKTGKITVRSNDKIVETNDVKLSEKKEEKVSVVSVIPRKKYQNHHTNQGKSSHPNFRKPPKVFTPLKESQTRLYERLKAAGMLHPIKGRPANPLGKFYRANHRCAYHSGAVGHDTENCSTLKNKIQNMLDNKLITFDEASPSGNMFHA